MCLGPGKKKKNPILLGRHILPRFTGVSNILSQIWSRPHRMPLCRVLEAFNLFADIKVTLIELYFWHQSQSKFSSRKFHVARILTVWWTCVGPPPRNDVWATEDCSSPVYHWVCSSDQKSVDNQWGSMSRTLMVRSWIPKECLAFSSLEIW